MSSLVLYRKYRPTKFSEVVGQEMTIRAITNAIAAGRQAHAYLFSGPRGIGKTTLARLIAKSVNCLNHQEGTFEPCNECSSCVSIAQGRAMDLIEIDAASNRGIDEIRDLKEGIKFSPSQLKYKFFIIDEVHMLTREAFNALLKTLEEPPEHALFVLATTEIHKVPETIVSRCQRFDFSRIPLEKMVEKLKLVAKKEGVETEKGALELIALNSTGGMRDAESLLGQIMAVQDKKITRQEVEEILGAVDFFKIKEFVDLLIQKDQAKGINFINDLLDQGRELNQFAQGLTNYLRKLMILQVDSSLSKIVAPDLTTEQIESIVNQGKKMDRKETLRLLKLLIVAGQEMKTAPIIQLPLELMVVEFLAK